MPSYPFLRHQGQMTTLRFSVVDLNSSLQMRRQTTAEPTRCSWNGKFHLSWQGAAELTSCSWPGRLFDKLQPSLQMAAELSWYIAAELAYCSWADVMQLSRQTELTDWSDRSYLSRQMAAEMIDCQGACTWQLSLTSCSCLTSCSWADMNRRSSNNTENDRIQLLLLIIYAENTHTDWWYSKMHRLRWCQTN